MIRLLDTIIIITIIIITIIIQFISLSEFFLKPKIIKNINNSIDMFTLRLDYIKTINWLRDWIVSSRRSNIAQIILGIITFIIFIASIAYSVYLILDSDKSLLNNIFTLIAVPFLFMRSWGLTFKIVQPIIEENSRFLSVSKSLKDFVLSFALLASIELLLIVILSIGLYLIIDWLGDENLFSRCIIFIFSNIWFGILISWILTFLDGIITLIIAFIIIISQWIIDILRLFMWKISSYPKGPLAAITALLSAIWAITRLVILK